MRVKRVLCCGIIISISILAFGRSLPASQIPSPALLVAHVGKGEWVHEGDHSLAIVDPATNKVVSRVPINGHPHEVVVSDDGKLAFVTNNSYSRDHVQPLDDAISVIDLAAQRELRRVDIGPDSWPHGIAFAGGKVYFTAEGYKLVGRYDPTANKIDWMLGTDQARIHMLVMSSDAKRIFTANTDSGTVSAIEPVDSAPGYEKIFHYGAFPSRVAVEIPVGKAPEGIALTPDGKEVWALNRPNEETGSVTIIDVATNKVSQTLDLKTTVPLRLKFTPDGKRAVICTAFTGEVLIFDAAARKEIKRMKVADKRLHGVLVTPDGSRAYVADMGGNRVAVINLKTLELTGYIESGEGPEGMAWVETK